MTVSLLTVALANAKPLASVYVAASSAVSCGSFASTGGIISGGGGEGGCSPPRSAELSRGGYQKTKSTKTTSMSLGSSPPSHTVNIRRPKPAVRAPALKRKSRNYRSSGKLLFHILIIANDYLPQAITFVIFSVCDHMYRIISS